MRCICTKKTIKKAIAVICIVATCSIAIVSTGALTRRLYGDVNGDGIISNADVTLLQQYLVKSATLDKYQLIAANVNGDNYVDVNDATMISKLISGLIDEFPVGDYFVY